MTKQEFKTHCIKSTIATIKCIDCYRYFTPAICTDNTCDDCISYRKGEPLKNEYEETNGINPEAFEL